MRGTMVIIPAAGEPNEARELEQTPSLEELQTVVGGHIEAVVAFDTIAINNVVLNCVAFCDEDGNRKQLPVNDRANAFWEHSRKRNGRQVHPGDRLVGPVVVLFGDRKFMSEL